MILRLGEKMNWDEFFISLTHAVRKKSKDRSTQVGAVIVGEDNEVLSIGFNGMPRGIDDELNSRHERPIKYKWFEHAERNAIYNAARHGIALKGSRIYVYGFPCTDCARAIIQSGIKELIYESWPDDPGRGERWNEDLKIAKEMFLESGITIREFK